MASGRQSASPALQIDDLQVTYAGEPEPVQAVRGVSLQVDRGGALAVIGESGSGKTTLGMAILRLLAGGAALEGALRVCGRDVLAASTAELRALRWQRVAAVIQAPGRGLNPVRSLASQITEPLRIHRGMSRTEARERARELAGLVGIDPDLLRRFPHEVSGGQAQRAMLAMALTCDPDLLVLDEPTSGLDTVTKDRLLDTVGELRGRRDTAVLLLTHDLAAAARLVDEVAVLYAGMIMERGPTAAVLEQPRHPYTRDLVGAYPTMTTQKDLRGIRGRPPDPTDPPGGCPYHPRCTQAIARCATWSPVFEPVAGRDVLCVRGGIVTLLAATGLHRSFPVRGGEDVRALRGVDVALHEGEVVGVVGPTASGKSTLARVLLGLLEPDAGTVSWEGRELAGFSAEELTGFRRDTAMIYQDPFDATSPRMSVAEVVREPLDAQRRSNGGNAARRVRELLDQVGLPTGDQFLARTAHGLSGGQLQRVAIARALVLGPHLLVADEPTSMLDASEQAKLMVLLKDLQVARGMALLLLSHDLALVRKAADHIVVLDDGEVVEQGPGAQIVAAPTHPVTRRLVAASPRLGLAATATANVNSDGPSDQPPGRVPGGTRKETA